MNDDSGSAGGAASVPHELRNLVAQAVHGWRTEQPDGSCPAREELAEAVLRPRIRVAYQPIVDLLDGRTVAVEALLRLDDPHSPELGSPPGVIEVAEASGLIRAVGLHVLATSCAQLAHWRRDEAPELQMHVNVSALELRAPGYVDAVHRVLRVCQVPADSLVLEITETAALENDGVSQRNLLALSTMGIDIALDDFGTGFASLDLLAATPARKLKLDRSFVASIGPQDGAVRGRGVIVQAAVGMARSLGLDIVGEGIESADQAHTLLAWGCQYGQGYLFSRPVPPSDLELRDATALRTTPLARTVDSGRLLSKEATDLALSLTTVLSATAPATRAVRHQAATVARIISSTVGDGRKHVETSVLLAGIADAPEHLACLTDDLATTSLAVQELDDLLRIPPIIGRRTPPGAVARTSWALAQAREAGASGYDPVLLAAHPDPEVDATLRRQVDRWWEDGTTGAAPRLDIRELEQRFRGRDDAAARLRALMGLARAVGATGSLDDLLEVTAEEARRAVGAASLSVSRWEPEEGLLRTLINVGDLAADEDRHPIDEIYDLRDYPEIAEQLRDGQMCIESITEPGPNAQQRAMLERRGRGSGASIPIIVEDNVWGELFVTSTMDDPPYTLADGPYLNAIASFVAIAIGRAEDLSRLTRLVNEDPLTRLPNRRRIEEHLTERLADTAREGPVALAMIDVEGLKHLNEAHGHHVGDAFLVRVADVLQRASLGQANAMAGRLGGDEFCLVLDGEGEQVRGVLHHLQERLAANEAPSARLFVGVAVSNGQAETFTDLLERADAAQYAAKRHRHPIVLDHEVDELVRTERPATSSATAASSVTPPPGERG